MSVFIFRLLPPRYPPVDWSLPVSDVPQGKGWSVVVWRSHVTGKCGVVSHHHPHLLHVLTLSLCQGTHKKKLVMVYVQ